MITRYIDSIFVHHTATPRDVSVDAIRNMHVDGRGWNDIGYHLIIDQHGRIHQGRLLNTIGAHAKGNNSTSVGVAVICDNTVVSRKMNDTQKDSLEIALRYLLLMIPGSEIFGHRDKVSTLCPAFNVRKFIEKRGIK